MLKNLDNQRFDTLGDAGQLSRINTHNMYKLDCDRIVSKQRKSGTGTCVGK